ncbi:MAG TPA: class I SAM-dependent methyltransferase [Deltaproteobacteria bacterium]|nr:class I SAM-dependent methyltransferase [Deltaproteobacteria bacterium]
MDSKRKTARQFARQFLEKDDPLRWFEALYSAAEGDEDIIPWADMHPNPSLMDWLDINDIHGNGKRALKIGCGLGDDAEILAERGFDVKAFDISGSAIDWCRKRFPHSKVNYSIQNLFESPPSWDRAFDFVLEAYTLQVLPPELRLNAIEQIARYAAPGGTLLVICRGREPGDDPGQMPWPVMKDELTLFEQQGLREVSFDDFLDDENPPVRRFRAVYKR